MTGDATGRPVVRRVRIVFVGPALGWIWVGFRGVRRVAAALGLVFVRLTLDVEMRCGAAAARVASCFEAER